MSYAIKCVDSHGNESYVPKGYGFTAHELTTSIASAESFTDEISANKRLNYWQHPPAFWESERRHRELTEAKYRNWRFTIVAI